MGETCFPLSSFCIGLLQNLQAENATVMSLACYARGGEISHRFLLIVGKLRAAMISGFIWIITLRLALFFFSVMILLVELVVVVVLAGSCCGWLGIKVSVLECGDEGGNVGV